MAMDLEKSPFTLDRKLRISVIGSFSARRADARVSGTVVSLKHLVADLKKRSDVELTVFDTGRMRRDPKARVTGMFSYMRYLYRELERCDVVTVHFSPNGFSVLGVIAVLGFVVFLRDRNKPVADKEEVVESGMPVIAK